MKVPLKIYPTSEPVGMLAAMLVGCC